jgi:3-deoxy-manno-octulosonate cytidylyltransferase (CMP-KDO synthetase)
LDAVKVVCDRQGQALYFSRFPIPYSRQAVSASDNIVGCLKHIGMYGYRREFLKNFCQQAPTLLEQAESLEQLRALEMGARIQVMKVDQKSWGVDRPEDILKIEEKLRSQI